MRAAGSAFLPGRRDQVKGRLAAAWSRALPFYLFIFLPSSIDLRLSLTHCHRAADHHLTLFSSQIYTKYWIFPPLRSHDNSLQNMVLTRQSSASIPVALPFLEDEIRVRSLGDP